ncbi:MAG: class I SAM-dependent methyltransferase [Phycisphaerales bacterium]
MRWDPPADARDLVLAPHQGRLELRGRDDAPGRGVCVDLGAVDPRGARSLPLAKAFGRGVRTIADATAGLLGDAYLLALLGHEVLAIERCPMVAALARDGLARAALDARVDAGALARLRLVEGDARTLLQGERPDAVLLDPMFPQRRKASALARKEIRLVRAAAGDDPDAAELFAAAMAAARGRVAVKRSDDAPPIVPAPAPSFACRGRTSRVDVYLAPTAARALRDDGPNP